MEHVRTDDVESWMGPASVKRSLGRALGTESMALNYYELEPGESFAFGYHRHSDQEEVFYLLSGSVTFTTEDGERVVEANEAVRFAPGEYQQGVNRSAERAVALAVGAPADAGETDVRRDCGRCGESTSQRIERSEDGDALVTRCVECDAETGRFD